MVCLYGLTRVNTMVMRRCDADEHHYDSSRHSSCPYCQQTVPRTRTVRAAAPREAADEAGDTVLMHSDPPPTQLKRSADDGLADTVLMPSADRQPEVTRIFGVDSARAPVAGWLVVTGDPGGAASRAERSLRGRDLRLVSGVNRIGRDPEMEICIDNGDDKISRNRHCAITFDPETNRFFLHSGENRHLTYIYRQASAAGEITGWDVLLDPHLLQPMDQLRVGDTVLIFVPLCGEAFSWDEET